jgi:hypothetical protein
MPLLRSATGTRLLAETDDFRLVDRCINWSCNITPFSSSNRLFFALSLPINASYSKCALCLGEADSCSAHPGTQIYSQGSHDALACRHVLQGAVRLQHHPPLPPTPPSPTTTAQPRRRCAVHRQAARCSPPPSRRAQSLLQQWENCLVAT